VPGKYSCWRSSDSILSTILTNIKEILEMKNIRDKKADKDVEIISHDIAYQGYFRIEKIKACYRVFEGGGWSNYIDREIFERGRAVAVIPYDPKLRKVVLIEQFRIGAMEDEVSPWLLEIVAGIIEPGETPEDVARREAKEEAGVNIMELIPITRYWVSPGGSTEHVDLFCGKVDASSAGGICGLDEEEEDIKVHVFDLEEAYALVQNGVINNSPAIIGIQWLMLNSDLG